LIWLIAPPDSIDTALVVVLPISMPMIIGAIIPYTRAKQKRGPQGEDLLPKKER
jgi:hypothetical protein